MNEALGLTHSTTKKKRKKWVGGRRERGKGREGERTE
jgi:hypothetical protein